MAVPKTRVSRTRRDKRRKSVIKITPPAIVLCPECGEYKLTHRACPACGKYKGRAVLSERTISRVR